MKIVFGLCWLAIKHTLPGTVYPMGFRYRAPGAEKIKFVLEKFDPQTKKMSKNYGNLKSCTFCQLKETSV